MTSLSEVWPDPIDRSLTPPLHYTYEHSTTFIRVPKGMDKARTYLLSALAAIASYNRAYWPYSFLRDQL